MTAAIVKPRTGVRVRLTGRVAIGACGFLLLAGIAGMADAIREPSMMLFGRIIATGAGRPFLATEGDLTWTIRKANGGDLVLRAKLRRLHSGEYSYRLPVPLSALANGLSEADGHLPVRSVADVNRHTRILVNGRPARILTPDAAGFAASQQDRAGSRRVDLEVALDATDSDGDGVPDWWENLHGVNDPQADLDHDGANNLAEYLRRTDPRKDDRIPSLATTEFRVYAGGTTLLGLRAVDVDSPAAAIQYAVAELPAGGRLRLRNAAPGGAEKDLVLGLHATFTQAAVNAGRVVFAQEGEGLAGDTSLVVTLRDDDPAHGVTTNRVRLVAYEPAPLSGAERQGLLDALPWRVPQLEDRLAADQARLVGFLLSREFGYVVWDGSTEADPWQVKVPSSEASPAEYEATYLPAFGPDRRHVLLGGLAADHLTGGMEADILAGGRGDDVLRGRAGSDLFVLLGPEDGNDVIEDFSVAENDVIDLSRVLTGSSSSLAQYLQVTQTGNDTQLRLNFSGLGGSYSDMTLTLVGVRFTAADLPLLVESGRLVTGDKSLPAQVSIVADAPTASENGPRPGGITLSRTGPVDAELTVQVRITGSAVNGVDFEHVTPEVVFAPGQRSVVIPIVPYPDSMAEPAEVVEVTVLAGPGLSLVGMSTARVTIQDLAPEISLEVLEPFAVKSSLSPALVAVRRAGVVDRSVLIRLDVGGSAVNGVDYGALNNFVNLAPGETARILTITPNPTANLSQGPKSVRLAVKSDPGYLVGTPANASVLLVDAALSFAGWRAQHFPDSAGTLETFALEDPGGQGIPNLLRYAYGLDPLAPDRTRMPRASIEAGYLTVEFWRRPEATDLHFDLEVSEDLVHWTDSPMRLESLAVAGGEAAQLMRYRALPGVAQQSTLFVRVRVTHSP